MCPCLRLVAAVTGRTLLFARRTVKVCRSEGVCTVQRLVQSLRYLLKLHPLRTRASTDSTCIRAGQRPGDGTQRGTDLHSVVQRHSASTYPQDRRWVDCPPPRFQGKSAEHPWKLGNLALLAMVCGALRAHARTRVPTPARTHLDRYAGHRIPMPCHTPLTRAQPCSSERNFAKS